MPAGPEILSFDNRIIIKTLVDFSGFSHIVYRLKMNSEHFTPHGGRRWCQDGSIGALGRQALGSLPISFL